MEIQQNCAPMKTTSSVISAIKASISKISSMADTSIASRMLATAKTVSLVAARELKNVTFARRMPQKNATVATTVIVWIQIVIVKLEKIAHAKR
jgi:hypothetical protein